MNIIHIKNEHPILWILNDEFFANEIKSKQTGIKKDFIKVPCGAFTSEQPLSSNVARCTARMSMIRRSCSTY
jgi:hypothetical protein